MTKDAGFATLVGALSVWALLLVALGQPVLGAAFAAVGVGVGVVRLVIVRRREAALRSERADV